MDLDSESNECKNRWDSSCGLVISTSYSVPLSIKNGFKKSEVKSFKYKFLGLIDTEKAAGLAAFLS
jgi:hypothetical protein